MQLQVSDEQLRSVVSAAVIQILTPESREKMLTEAVKNLITPEKDTSYPYKTKKSPLEQAFENEVYAMSRTIIGEMLEKDEKIKTAVNEIIQKAVEKVMIEEKEETIGRLATNLRDWMSSSQR